MIGALDPRSRKVTVIGGGISGLLSAYYADQAGFEVTLHEKSKRLGGLIETRYSTYGLIETAAHSLMVNGATRRLFGQLGIPLYPIDPKSRARFIVRDGKMKKFPLHIGEIARAIYNAGRRPAIEKHTSLEEWGNRHLGREITQYLLEPMVTGIFACSPSELSTGAAFPNLVVEPGLSLFQQLRKSRGLKKERSTMMSPAGGMASLTKALSGYLTLKLGDRMKLGSEVTELPPDGNIVICTDAAVAASLLQSQDPKMAKAVASVEYAPLLSVTVFAKRGQFEKEPQGVGVLIPRSEGYRSLGVLFNSSSFPHRVTDDSLVSFTVMLGGTRDKDAVRLTEVEIKDIITFELQKLLGLKGEPAYLEINRWPRAIPIYSDQVEIVWDLARRGWCSKPGQILFGNYSGKVSIRGMIEDAENLFVSRLLVDHPTGAHVTSD